MKFYACPFTVCTHWWIAFGYFYFKFFNIFCFYTLITYSISYNFSSYLF